MAYPNLDGILHLLEIAANTIDFSTHQALFFVKIVLATRADSLKSK